VRTFAPEIIDFLKTDVWRIRSETLPGPKSFVLKLLRIILLAFRGFKEDRVYLRASALTFYSLLSLVPVAALAFGVAKGFGFEKLLEKQLYARFTGQEAIVSKVIVFAHSYLESTKGGIIAGIGLAALFWAVIKVLSNIEYAFNDIWGVKEARSFGRKFSDYLSIMIISPLLLIVSSSATVFLRTQVTLITERIALLEHLGFIIFFLLKLLPYLSIWVLFIFTYIMIPNTKVSLRSGIVGGIVGGTIYQIAQWVYITFQIGVAKYNAIYGSFAALPLFLIWLQVSWLVVLLGAEICFAHQNVDTYEFEPDSFQISAYFKSLLSLGVAHLVIKRFTRGEKPLTAAQISHALEIPVRLVRQILYELVGSGVLSATTTGAYKEMAYQPARDVNGLTVGRVIEALSKRGADTLPVPHTQEIKALSESLEALREDLRKSPANKRLKDI